MEYTRREFGQLTFAGVVGAAFTDPKPNSLIDGVQIGTITYSYRSMPDQSAEATLKYIVDSGISAIELMGGPVESFAGAPSTGRGGGRPGGPPPGGARQGPPPGGDPGARGGGRGRGRAEVTPEQQAAQREAAEKIRQWRTSVSMDRFKALRKMYNDAGVTIYAWKQLNPNMSDGEMEYVFNVAEALGCTHTTLELTDNVDQLKRIGDFAERKKIYAAYHTHVQGSMTAFDKAFAASNGNMANVDLGHYVAGGNVGGTTIQFLEKFHDRIASFHLKDRTTPEHGAKNLPWGAGDTPIREILQTVKKNRWKMPASIELEYEVPEGSDAVREVRKCLQFCRDALA